MTCWRFPQINYYWLLISLGTQDSWSTLQYSKPQILLLKSLSVKKRLGQRQTAVTNFWELRANWDLFFNILGYNRRKFYSENIYLFINFVPNIIHGAGIHLWTKQNPCLHIICFVVQCKEMSLHHRMKQSQGEERGAIWNRIELDSKFVFFFPQVYPFNSLLIAYLVTMLC